jgi:hypothetical protein
LANYREKKVRRRRGKSKEANLAAEKVVHALSGVDGHGLAARQAVDDRCDDHIIINRFQNQIIDAESLAGNQRIPINAGCEKEEREVFIPRIRLQPEI